MTTAPGDSGDMQQMIAQQRETITLQKDDKFNMEQMFNAKK